ncbi:MAG: tRNA pseudouridine(38-40) synthase TruA [Clostridia bacterium]|nr:tRNA pseudouridine(38-40) synthase TruA [Clostridia bacterium]
MIIKLIISYDGTNYCGYQKQKNGVSVQEVLEQAIEKATGKIISTTASGRTDAGVHAEGQVVSFSYEGSIPPERFYLALNPLLPSDIRAVDSCIEKEDFNARKSAKKKTYSYSFYYSGVELPLKDRYALCLEKEPNLAKIKECAKLLEGEHDFKAFCATKSSVKSTTRTIYSIKIEEKTDGFSINVSGSGFLYNMVRIIAGTLLDVGYEKKTKEDILLALKDGKREHLSKTLPAKALTLKQVEY